MLLGWFHFRIHLLIAKRVFFSYDRINERNACLERDEMKLFIDLD